MKKKIIFCLLLTLHQLSHGTFTFFGDNIMPLTFTEIVLSETYGFCENTWYLTLDDANGGAGNFAIAKLAPDATAFTGIANHPLTNNKQINIITHAKKLNQVAPFLSVIDNATPTQVIALSTDGTAATQSVVLNDAVGAPTAALVSLAANSSQIFTGTGDFLTTNSGVAVINVTEGTLALDAVNAQTGISGGNTAQFFDKVPASTPAGVMGPDNAIFYSLGILHFDETLDLLYCTALGVPSTTTTGDGTRSVVVGDVTSAGVLTFRAMMPTATLVNNQLTNMIGATIIAGTVVVLQIPHIDIMHASTGPSYLIGNGGVYVVPITDNKARNIFALPLIDNTLTPATHGTIADKNSALVDGKFVTAPTVNADLPLETDASVQVGAGPLPTPILTGIAGTDVTDLKAIGDTVYVSNATTNGASSENGIFYSTALFDETGKIVRWTPWAKKAAPFDLFPALVPGTIPLAQRGKVNFFEIDTANGEMLFIDGHITTATAVGRTTWTTTSTATSLLNSVNVALTDASTAILDLPRSTRGFGTAAGDGRYALFGGNEQVIFTKLTEAKASATGAEDIIEAFDPIANPDHILATTLPTGAGPVKQLEYSRRLGGTADSYFFAGTDTGLFAFAAAGGGGFDVTATPPGDLNAAPFTGRTWQAAPNLDQTIIDIKTSGRALYCITCVSSSGFPPDIKVLRIPFTTNISTMFAPANIFVLAQAGTGVFENVPFFNNIEIVATDDPLLATAADKEQLVLATSNGLFVSNATQAAAATGVIAATNQTTAAWQLINSTDNTFFSNSFTHDTPIRHTSWHISSTDNGTTIFDKSNLHQFSAAGTPGAGDPPLFPSNFNPVNFNDNRFNSSFEQITTLWTDGSRRLIATLNGNSGNQLQSVPFDTSRNCLSMPTTLIEASSSSATGFNWLHNLHNGSLVAGTNEGIIALQ